MCGVVDLWTYRREKDLSRLRLAAAAVDYVLGPDAWVELREGVVYAVIPRPWWAALTMGAWDAMARRRAVERCELWVPRICGWCPEIRVATA